MVQGSVAGGGAEEVPSMAKRRLAWADTLLSTVLSSSQLNFDLLVNVPAVDTVTVTRIVGHVTITTASLTGVGAGIQRIDSGI